MTVHTPIIENNSKTTTLSEVTMIIDGVTYHDIVPRAYRFNPETDELIYGDDLQNDMMVLIAQWDARCDETLPDLYNAGLIIKNRWCEVTRLRVSGNAIYFVAVYSDGNKTIRSSTETQGWIVKKNSIVDNSSVEKFIDG